MFAAILYTAARGISVVAALNNMLSGLLGHNRNVGAVRIVPAVVGASRQRATATLTSGSACP